MSFLDFSFFPCALAITASYSPDISFAHSPYLSPSLAVSPVSSPPTFPHTQVQFKNMKFLMWDIGGQESLRTSWATYYSGAKVRRADLTASYCVLSLSKETTLIFYSPNFLSSRLSSW